MVEEDVTIARWGLAATMVVGFMLASAFLCWLHERDIHPFEPNLKFLRAHWPMNLHHAPTGIEVYAEPLLSTNGWIAVGTAPVIDGDNSAVTVHSYFAKAKTIFA